MTIAPSCVKTFNLAKLQRAGNCGNCVAQPDVQLTRRPWADALPGIPIVDDEKENCLVFNTTAAKYSTLAIEIDIARRTGFDGIETTTAKIRDYLEVDHTPSDFTALLNGLTLCGIGPVFDIERHGGDAHALMTDAHATFELAHFVGAKAVQVITGPLDYREVIRFKNGQPKSGYRGVLDYNEEDRLTITAAALKALAKSAQDFNLVVYLEALAWTPLNTIAHQIELLRRVNEDNLKMVVDYWHCYASGDKPEDVAKIESDLIYGVHVCDSLRVSNEVPNEAVARDVITGQGILDLSAWTDAVKATGYKGWWSSETFCRKIQQENSYDIAAQMKTQLTSLAL
jgi:sugar phosphate isomerase/epimerase